MTLDDINKAVRRFVRETLTMPENSVRPANQTAPTGPQTEQFATVLITLIQADGEDDRRLTDVPDPSMDVIERLTGQRRLSASIQFFRGDAYDKAVRLGALISMSRSVESLQALELGFIRASPVRNLTGVIDAAWEARAQLDIEFYIISAEAQSLPSIDPLSVPSAVSVSYTHLP